MMSDAAASTNETVEVPLNTLWTFWIDKTERGASAAQFEASLQKVYSVSSVQGFWSVFHNIPDVKELKNRYSYHLMRGDRKPLWEDELNREGGSWRFKIAKRDSPKAWKELLLAAIGEQFSSCVKVGDDVCGVSVTVRENDDILQIWTENASLAQNNLLHKVHQLLPNTMFLAEFYRAHFENRSFEGEKRR